MFAPMKYKHLEDPTLLRDLLADPAWAVEQKMDGTYGMAVLRHGHPPLMTQNGRDPLKHTAATQHLPGIWDALADVQLRLEPGEYVVLEGEVMIHTGEYRVWDMPASILDRYVTKPEAAWWYRKATLFSLMETFVPTAGPVRQVPAFGGTDKADFLGACKAAGVEGIVLKHREATYRPGERVSDVLKYKFVKTADVVVTGWERAFNEAGRETGYIKFGVHDPETRSIVDVGRCSIIGKPDVKIGDVIEVAYLYWTGQTTYQPRMVRVREDKPVVACLADQFQPYSREVV